MSNGGSGQHPPAPASREIHPRCETRGHGAHSFALEDRGFESISLHRRVGCEPDSLTAQPVEMGSIEPVHRGPAPQPVAHVETISTIGWPDVAGDALRQHCYDRRSNIRIDPSCRIRKDKDKPYPL